MTRAGSMPTKSMQSGTAAPGRASIAARTLRTDNWRKAPLLTFTLLSIWVLYALVRTVSQRAYFVQQYHYLSPFSSPCVSASCPSDARDFGTWFGHFPPFIPLALLVLPFLLGFRLTCYYYRRAYYRAFWQSPPACAVAEPHQSYSGETKFPLIFQNLHRYFFAAAVVISLINTYDAIRSFQGADGGVRYRSRDVDHGGQRRAALGVHAVVPLVPAHHRRPGAQLLAVSDAVQGVDASFPSSTPSTCNWPGRRLPRSCSPTATSRWSPPARSPI